MDGFFLIDKLEGWTSRDVVTKIFHKFHTRKVGHTGTLDPFATGLLIVSIGAGNKASHFLEGLDKEYIAELKLCSSTSTGDKNGDVLDTKEVPDLNEEHIKEVLDSFLGKQSQIPPKYSAVHVHGVKAYKLMYHGIEIKDSDIKPREIEIKNIEFISYENHILKFKALVSKGTYIRVLGEDIAKRLNTIGHLITLRRTKVGLFNVEDAVSIDDTSEDTLVSISDGLKHLPHIVATGKNEYKAVHGANIDINIAPNENRILIVDINNKAIAVYDKVDGRFVCTRGIYSK